MIAPSMGQFTSGANVTKISMVTILGPAVPPTLTPVTSHQTPVNRQGDDMIQTHRRKFTSPIKTKTHRIAKPHLMEPPTNKAPIKDTLTPQATVIVPTIINSKTATIMLATMLTKIK